MKGLVWFRSDLRTDDNPALRSAFEQCDEVIAIYLYSPIQAALHNESNIKNDFEIGFRAARKPRLVSNQ